MTLFGKPIKDIKLEIKAFWEDLFDEFTAEEYKSFYKINPNGINFWKDFKQMNENVPVWKAILWLPIFTIVFYFFQYKLKSFSKKHPEELL